MRNMPSANLDQRVSHGDYLIVLEGTETEIRTAETVLNNRGVSDWGIYDVPGVNTNPRMGIL
ncbi:hypothetical protein [Lyngbya aestuarii]|uniref:hypothetical protein n=1 Tax=Lyngbya aestuarii TaxID=118322 RepID=UPI00403DEDBF